MTCQLRQLPGDRLPTHRACGRGVCDRECRASAGLLACGAARLLGSGPGFGGIWLLILHNRGCDLGVVMDDFQAIGGMCQAHGQILGRWHEIRVDLVHTRMACPTEDLVGTECPRSLSRRA